MAPSGTTLRDRAFSLLEPGRIEILLAVGLALLVVLLEIITGQTWANIVIDLIACALTVVAAKWPRGGGLAVGLFLAVRVLLPPEYGGVLGEYAPLITLLGLGMRGERHLRAILSAAYLPLMWLASWSPARPMTTFIVGLPIWAAMVGLMWIIGNAYHAVTEAQERARAAELVLQRQVLARELHDTVARSFTRVSMVAERARLRGAVSEHDLDTITDEAARGVDELRWVMSLLRDPSASVEALAASGTSLASALTAAQDDLARDGFTTTVSVEGDLSRLTTVQSETLAAVTGEAVANMTKHGDPSQPSGIVVQVGETEAELAFINAAAPSSGDDDRERLGVWGMGQRLDGLGGSVQTGAEDQHWVTRIRLPLSAEVKE
jgi:signal transduction histidine kinase